MAAEELSFKTSKVSLHESSKWLEFLNLQIACVKLRDYNQGRAVASVPCCVFIESETGDVDKLFESESLIIATVDDNDDDSNQNRQSQDPEQL